MISLLLLQNGTTYFKTLLTNRWTRNDASFHHLVDRCSTLVGPALCLHLSAALLLTLSKIPVPSLLAPELKILLRVAWKVFGPACKFRRAFRPAHGAGNRSATRSELRAVRPLWVSESGTRHCSSKTWKLMAKEVPFLNKCFVFSILFQRALTRKTFFHQKRMYRAYVKVCHWKYQRLYSSLYHISQLDLMANMKQRPKKGVVDVNGGYRLHSDQ